MPPPVLPRYPYAHTVSVCAPCYIYNRHHNLHMGPLLYSSHSERIHNSLLHLAYSELHHADFDDNNLWLQRKDLPNSSCTVHCATSTPTSRFYPRCYRI